MYEQPKPGMNFGRKGFAEPTPEVTGDFETKNRKPDKKVMYSTGSKYIFREINLFIPEAIAIVIGGMATVFLLVLGILFNTQMLLILAPFPPLVILILFFIYRKAVFIPGKNRHFTKRILPSGQIRYSIDDIGKGEIPFDNSPLSPKIRITNPKKNVNFTTGLPDITLKAGESENSDLRVSQNTSQQSLDFDNYVISAIGVQKAWDEYNIAAPKKNMEIIIFIMCAITICAAGAAAYLAYQNGQLLADIATKMPSMIQTGIETANKAAQQAAVTITTTAAK